MSTPLEILILTTKQPEDIWLINRLADVCRISGVVLPVGKRYREFGAGYVLRKRIPKLGILRVANQALLVVYRWVFERRADRRAAQNLFTGVSSTRIERDCGDVLEVEDINSEVVRDFIVGKAPRLVVVSNTPLLKKGLREAAPGRIINLHPGYPPKYRGRYNSFWPVYNHEPDLVGATIHYVDERIDTGRILIQRRVEFDPRDTLRAITLRQHKVGVELLVTCLKDFETFAACADVKTGCPGCTYLAPGLTQYLKGRSWLRGWARAQNRGAGLRGATGFRPLAEAFASHQPLRFRRVLLVQPPHVVEWPGLTPPIGLGYLEESLRRHGIQCEVLDMNLGYSVKQLLRHVDRFQPDLLGMSMITRNYRGFYQILEAVKNHASEVKIVAGGPHVTILREKVLQDCAAIDYGVVNEGEETLVELCQDQAPEKSLRGLLYRDGSGIAYAGDREIPDDMDRVPWPRYETFELRRYFNEISIHTSRGCPYRCIFCARHVLSPRFRARSAISVAEELEFWHRKGYRKFNFEDDNFNLNAKRVYDICDEIERRGLSGLILRCSNGIRADRADRAMLARMRDVGFQYLAFGVDAGNDRMLKVVRKGETMHDIEDAIRNACELGYSTKLFFVIGNPSETPEDVEDMVRLCRKYPIQEVHFNNVVPYPGTDLFDWIRQKGYFLRDPEEYLNNASFWEKRAIFRTPELPEKERIRLTHYLRRVRDDVHRTAIRRMFAGHALLGGVASRILSIRWFERYYYRSRLWRGLVERFRYQLAAGN